MNFRVTLYQTNDHHAPDEQEWLAVIQWPTERHLKTFCYGTTEQEARDKAEAWIVKNTPKAKTSPKPEEEEAI